MATKVCSGFRVSMIEANISSLTQHSHVATLNVALLTQGFTCLLSVVVCWFAYTAGGEGAELGGRC